MAKGKKPDLAQLEVELRDLFQKYRRRIDMLTRFKALGKTVSDEEVGGFIAAMNDDDEAAARKIMRIIEVQRG